MIEHPETAGAIVDFNPLTLLPPCSLQQALCSAFLKGPQASGLDDRERVGRVAKLELLGLAQVIAVDLVGERTVPAHGEGRQIRAVVDLAVATQPAARAERGRDEGQETHRVEAAERDRDEAPLAVGVGGHVERTTAEV